MKTSALAIAVALLSISPAASASADCIDYGGYMHWLGGVGSTGTVPTVGAPRLAAAGSYAYVSWFEQASPGGSFEHSMRIVEFSDPQNPRVVSALDLEVEDVAVSGHHVYLVTADDRLVVVDAGNPDTPVAVGEITLPGCAIGVAVAGTHAYAACLGFGLQVIDVTDPENPQIVGDVNVPGQTEQIAIDGSHAYLASFDDGFRVIDVSNPSYPLEVGVVKTAGFAIDVAVSEGYAYVAEASYDITTFSGLEVVDVADPTRPTIVGSIETSDYATGVKVSGATAYVANRHAGVVAIDVADPTDPRIVGRVFTGCARDVAVTGNIVCTSNDVAYDGARYAVQLIDVTNPVCAPVIGRAHMPDDVYGIASCGDYAYAAARTDGLQVIDLGDPGDPTIVATVGLFWALGVTVSDSYAYVTAGYGPRELFVVDISDPLHPVELGSTTMFGWCRGVAVSGDHAYVGDEAAGLTVVDVSDPHAPVIVAGVPTPGSAGPIVISGDHAYLGAGGLQIVDITDPLDPRIVGSASVPVIAIAVEATYAYVASSEGLQIVDVANPEAPFLVSTTHTPTSARGVAVEGNYAYVGSSLVTGNGTTDAEVTVIDVSDPYAPRIRGSFEGGGSVTISNGCVLSASSARAFVAASKQCDVTGVTEVVDVRPRLRVQAFPNPFVRATAIRVRLPIEQYVRASVIDVTGRRVRVLLDGILDPAGRELRWDGRDGAGRDVAPGVYVVRVETSGEIGATRVVALR